MAFMIYCRDKPGHGAVRAETRATHLDYLGGFADRVIIAGPLLDESGSNMVGSLLLMDFASRAEAEAFAAGDPYAKAGLFESVTIMPWKQVLPRD